MLALLQMVHNLLLRAAYNRYFFSSILHKDPNQSVYKRLAGYGNQWFRNSNAFVMQARALSGGKDSVFHRAINRFLHIFSCLWRIYPQSADMKTISKTK